ncbi:ATP synthase F1 subunit gamma [Candidatus Curtissbacteria bacterium]|nr:ATP synthase F1 subunit gamma [Candidatus Curtissbacteria bacterium]
MAQIREIKRRIKSINNTAKVTHAMELVAAAKMRKSQEKALSSRPYTIALNQMISEVRPKTHKQRHQLLTPTGAPSQLVILITSDRGLVGGLNLNVIREAATKNGNPVKFVVVGKKGLTFTVKTGKSLLASFLSDEQPFLDLARTLTRLAIGSFVTQEVNSVFIVYPQFVTTIKQVPTTIKLLPIELEEVKSPENGPLKDILLFEPSPDRILESILPHFVLTRIYQALLEAKASEHSARMVAMKNATDAASDLVEDLTLTYNQARQEAITKELLDIVTAQAALE